MRPFVHPQIDEVTLPTVLSALADPVRLAIVHKLHGTKNGLCCNDAAPGGNLPKSTLSHHFRILREAGLIHTEKHGLLHINRLRRTDINRKFPGLLKLVLSLSDNDKDDR